MKTKRYFFLGLFFLLTAALFPADDENEEGKIVRITGTVRLVGSATLPELVIADTAAQWYIVEMDDRDRLFDLQQQTVTVEGKETVREMTFANGRPAGTRRELSNISIIENLK